MGTYLDKCWACRLHLANEKAVPPDGSPSVALDDEKEGTGEEDRDKKSEKVE